MSQSLTVTPHPQGDWLVAVRGACFAVPPRLGRALLPLQGSRPDRATIRTVLEGADSGAGPKTGLSPVERVAMATLAELLSPESPRSAGRRGRSPRRALWLRIPLIPGRIVARTADRLRFLTSWPALETQFLLGIGGYLAPWLIPALEGMAVAVPRNIPGAAAGPALLLFLVTALWHEFGHAAALARHRYAPGGIGAGLLFVIPVLFADVTPIGALPARGRARVDLAGVCFQLALGGVLFAAGSLPWPSWVAGGFPPGLLIAALRSAGILALASVIWSLFPLIRSDGYWLLCDLLGVPDLERPLSGFHSWPVRVFLVSYRLVNVAFLAFMGKLIFSRVLSGWDRFASWPGCPIENPAWMRAGRILLVGLLALIGFRVLRRVTGMLRSSWLDLRRRI